MQHPRPISVVACDSALKLCRDYSLDTGCMHSGGCSCWSGQQWQQATKALHGVLKWGQV
jgi:hypothetical protein